MIVTTVSSFALQAHLQILDFLSNCCHPWKVIYLNLLHGRHRPPSKLPEDLPARMPLSRTPRASLKDERVVVLVLLEIFLDGTCCSTTTARLYAIYVKYQYLILLINIKQDLIYRQK